MHYIRSAAAVCAAAAVVGCGGVEDARSVTGMYRVPASLDELAAETFFDHPWPSDFRLEGGAPRLTGYPNPRHNSIIDGYIDAVRGQIHGFSPAGAGFLRFTGAIDPTSLPTTPSEARSPASSVQLVDVDPSSSEHGRRMLVSLLFRGPRGVYIPDNTLAFMPTAGFPLRPHTRYALVVTDALRAADGRPVARAPELSQALGLEEADGPTLAAQAIVAPAAAELAKAGIQPSNIVHLAVFTTADPGAELFALRDALRADVPTPSPHADAWARKGSTADYDEYVGVFGPSPNYQAGKIPFANAGDGGAFNYDVAGHPQVVDYFDPRFSLTVPNAKKCPMPDSGYPIVLYAHGTGGDYRSYIEDGTARSLARHCLASMGVDQIFHGTRPGSPEVTGTGNVDVLFFNFKNIVAARTNGRQSALDEVQRARLFTESTMIVPAKVSTTPRKIRFDPAKVLFFGHSQGGLNGPLYLAADDSARGGVLSGSSALLSITLLEKTEPAPSVAGLVETLLLGLGPSESDELTIFHPGISLAQTLIDVVDPVNYAAQTAQEPRDGFVAKSVYMTEGVNPDGTGDHYAPPHGIEAHARAMGLPLQLPAQVVPVECAWGGPAPVTIPPGGLADDIGDGEASGVLAQWAVPAGDDGHFVVFDVPGATLQAASFLQELAADPHGRVPAP